MATITTDHSPIHGQGTFATQALPFGHLLLEEADLWPLTNATLQDDADLLASYRRFPSQSQDAILTLSGGFTSVQQGRKTINSSSQKDAARLLRDIFFTNSHGDDDNEANHIFAAAARVNHSCRPNCELHFDGQVAQLFAVRKLAKDEELTINYCQPLWVSDMPHAYLKRRYKIEECKCELCELTAYLSGFTWFADWAQAVFHISSERNLMPPVNGSHKVSESWTGTRRV